MYYTFKMWVHYRCTSFFWGQPWYGLFRCYVLTPLSESKDGTLRCHGTHIIFNATNST